MTSRKTAFRLQKWHPDSYFCFKNHLTATSGAKFGSVSGSPSHNPFHVVGMAQARYFSEGFLPQTSSDFYFCIGKAVFREVIHGLFKPRSHSRMKSCECALIVNVKGYSSTRSVIPHSRMTENKR